MKDRLLRYIAPRLRVPLQGIREDSFADLREIRLRVHRPLVLQIGNEDMFVTGQGGLTRDPGRGIIVEADDLSRTLAAITESSVYALEEEMRRGFITLEGGHRVGLAGTTWLRQGEVAGFTHISGLSLRVAREIPGCADVVVPWIKPGRGRICSTLVIGPPAAGKTTLLRDLARQLASGSSGVNVSLIDERSELAACHQGVPQLDVGIRTDVIDACPKAIGMMMAIRALNPRVVVTDEVGRVEDVVAIRECLNAGVAVIASAHASGMEEVLRRPGLGELIREGCFKRGLVLSPHPRPGTLIARLIFDQGKEGMEVDPGLGGVAVDCRLGWRRAVDGRQSEPAGGAMGGA